MSDKPPIEGNLGVTMDDMTIEATAPAYNRDFVLWAENQAEALRAAAHSAADLHIDWDNVAEEIDALAKNQQRELASRISRIIEHLTKLQLSPALHARAGWRATIREQRDELDELFEVSPSLRSSVSLVIARRIEKATTLALMDLIERGEISRNVDIRRHVPTFTEAQVLGDWFPNEDGVLES
jgi:hypothetical protein